MSETKCKIYFIHVIFRDRNSLPSHTIHTSPTKDIPTAEERKTLKKYGYELVGKEIL